MIMFFIFIVGLVWQWAYVIHLFNSPFDPWWIVPALITSNLVYAYLCNFIHNQLIYTEWYDL